MQGEQYPISRQECSIQRIRDQEEVNAQIVNRLQAEVQAKKQYQFSKTVRQVNRDCLDQLVQVPHRQNRHPSLLLSIGYC